MLGLILWEYEKGINHSLKRPVEKDFKCWSDYWQSLCEYLYLKYKDTYPKRKDKNGG